MSRLRSILRGTRQIRSIEIPLKNLMESDAPARVTVGLAVQSGDDYAVILKGATKFAIDRGGEPKDGSELYDYGKAVYTIAITCVDPESDPQHPIPFFGDSDNPSVEERVSCILSHPNIGRDTILFLAEHQDVWQDECSPQGDGKRDRTPEEYYQMLAEVAAEGPLAVMRLSAATRLKLVLFSVNLLHSLPMLNSISGSPSTTTP